MNKSNDHDESLDTRPGKVFHDDPPPPPPAPTPGFVASYSVDPPGLYISDQTTPQVDGDQQ